MLGESNSRERERDTALKAQTEGGGRVGGMTGRKEDSLSFLFLGRFSLLIVLGRGLVLEALCLPLTIPLDLDDGGAVPVRGMVNGGYVA